MNTSKYTRKVLPKSPPTHTAFYTRGRYIFMSYTLAYREQSRLEKKNIKAKLIPGNNDTWELEIK